MSKTIQIFLRDSIEDGIKIAELTNSIARVYVIPKSHMEFIQARADLDSPSLYMLFDEERTSVYIGECESFRDRVVSHIANKSFWHLAVVCVAKGTSMDKADVKFLESYAIQKAIEIGRLEVQNRTSPTRVHLHEFKEASVLDLFSDFELLFSTLGFTLFERVHDPISENPTTLKTEKNDKDTREYDTVIAPCTGDGLNDAFRKHHAWWAIRIGRQNIPKLKYIGLYEGAPVSAIRYYAKITQIEPYKEIPGKYIVYHDGNIQTLIKPVIIGKHPELSLYGPRYYKLSDIQNSETLAQLTDKAFGTDYQSK